HILVIDSLLAAEQGIEPLVVKVERIDLMPALAERLCHGPEQRPVEARFNRMGMHDQYPHQAASTGTGCSPSNSQTRPASKSKSGFSQPIILPGLSMPCGSASCLKASCARSVFFIPPSSSV